MLTRVSVFKDFFKPSCVVAHLHVEEIAEVVLVTNIGRGVKYINAAAKRFCYHDDVFLKMNIVFLGKENKNERTLLDCAIYPIAGF